jgi:hypothetical protein
VGDRRADLECIKYYLAVLLMKKIENICPRFDDAMSSPANDDTTPAHVRIAPTTCSVVDAKAHNVVRSFTVPIVTIDSLRSLTSNSENISNDGRSIFSLVHSVVPAVVAGFFSTDDISEIDKRGTFSKETEPSMKHKESSPCGPDAFRPIANDNLERYKKMFDGVNAEKTVKSILSKISYTISWNKCEIARSKKTLEFVRFKSVTYEYCANFLAENERFVQTHAASKLHERTIIEGECVYFSSFQPRRFSFFLFCSLLYF